MVSKLAMGTWLGLVAWVIGCSFAPTGVPANQEDGGAVDGATQDATPGDASPADASLPVDAPPPPCTTDPAYTLREATGQRYRRVTMGQTWDTARMTCETDGAYLAVIDDESENGHVRILGGGSVWIGLNDKTTEGTWVWVNGSPPTYTRWDFGEPNNSGDEDCAEMLDGLGDYGDWNDSGCTNSRWFVCECDAVP